MRFHGLDLNLVVLLNAVLEDGSVTDAARRLNLSQPAASAGLNRLREFFGDPLMVPVGRRMMPTPLTEELRPLIRRLVGDAGALVGTSANFDPATSRRQFRIGASDYILTVLITPLLRLIEHAAPRISIDVLPTGRETFALLDRGEIDLMIVPEPYLVPSAPAEPLFEERHVVLGWSDNPALNEPLTEERFFELKHVTVRIGMGRDLSFAEGHLAPYSERRRIEVTTTHFSSVPWMLIGSDRVAVLQERLARAFMEYLPLRSQTLPFEIPPLTEIVQYHPTRRSDPGLRWLIAAVKRLADTS